MEVTATGMHRSEAAFTLPVPGAAVSAITGGPGAPPTRSSTARLEARPELRDPMDTVYCRGEAPSREMPSRPLEEATSDLPQPKDNHSEAGLMMATDRRQLAGGPSTAMIRDRMDRSLE